MNNPNKPNTKTTVAIIVVIVLAAACAVVAVLLGVRSTDQPKTLVQTAETKPEIDLKIKGNKSSRIYHMQGCPNYNDIAERNIRWFKTTEEAETAGYRIAKNC